MSSYLKTVNIDITQEIRKRGQRLKRIGRDIPPQYLDSDECYERALALAPRIADNLEVAYNEEQMRKRIKVYSLSPKDILTKSIGKEDIIYAPMWLTALGAFVPRLLPDYLMATMTGMGITAATLNAFLYSRVVAHTNPLTGDIKIPTYPLCRNRYDFEFVASHELTHGFWTPMV